MYAIVEKLAELPDSPPNFHPIAGHARRSSGRRTRERWRQPETHWTRHPPRPRVRTGPSYDFAIVSESSGRLDEWRSIRTEVLLMVGSKRPAYLKGRSGISRECFRTRGGSSSRASTTAPRGIRTGAATRRPSRPSSGDFSPRKRVLSLAWGA
jgi:hypothetical protein